MFQANKANRIKLDMDTGHQLLPSFKKKKNNTFKFRNAEITTRMHPNKTARKKAPEAQQFKPH